MIHQVVFCFLVTFFSPAVAAEEAEAPEAEVSTETTADLESTVSQVTTETLGESSAITTDQIGEEPEEKPEYAVAAAVAANPVEAGKDIARDPERLIRTVLELAGIKKHIDDIPGLVMSQLLHRRDELDPAVFSRAEKIIKEAYDQEDLFRSAVNK